MIVWVVLFDITAVAVNWAESPGFAVDAGAVTVTDVTVGDGGVGVGVVGVDVDPAPPQLSTATMMARHTKPRNVRFKSIPLEIVEAV